MRIQLTDDDRTIVFRDYIYNLHQIRDDKPAAMMEASCCRLYGNQTTSEDAGKTRACVKILSDGRWGVYTRTSPW